MTDATKRDIRDTVKILMLLDEKSLLLIDSGARLLMARQNMDKKLENGQLQEAYEGR